MIDILVPAEQEGTTAVVRSWLKKVGDAVAEHDPLVELETDKVTQEVSSPAAGDPRGDPAVVRRRGGAGRGTGTAARRRGGADPVAAPRRRHGGRDDGRRGRRRAAGAVSRGPPRPAAARPGSGDHRRQRPRRTHHARGRAARRCGGRGARPRHRGADAVPDARADASAAADRRSRPPRRTRRRRQVDPARSHAPCDRREHAELGDDRAARDGGVRGGLQRDPGAPPQAQGRSSSRTGST